MTEGQGISEWMGGALRDVLKCMFVFLVPFFFCMPNFQNKHSTIDMLLPGDFTLVPRSKDPMPPNYEKVYIGNATLTAAAFLYKEPAILSTNSPHLHFTPSLSLQPQPITKYFTQNELLLYPPASHAPSYGCRSEQ